APVRDRSGARAGPGGAHPPPGRPHAGGDARRAPPRRGARDLRPRPPRLPPGAARQVLPRRRPRGSASHLRRPRAPPAAVRSAGAGRPQAENQRAPTMSDAPNRPARAEARALHAPPARWSLDERCRKFPILAAARERVLVFDGAMGTMIQRAGLTADDFGGPKLEGCNELLCATRPDVISKIHAAYYEAGADIVETN